MPMLSWQKYYTNLDTKLEAGITNKDELINSLVREFNVSYTLALSILDEWLNKNNMLLKTHVSRCDKEFEQLHDAHQQFLFDLCNKLGLEWDIHGIPDILKEVKKTTILLQLAQAVIQEFVYKNALMTPQQREVWKVWQEANK